MKEILFWILFGLVAATALIMGAVSNQLTPYQKFQSYASCEKLNLELADMSVGKSQSFECNILLK